MMNYYGYLLSSKVNSKSLYEFLRKAMMLLTKEKPFRGPSRFNEGDFEYLNEVEGDIYKVKGTETIYFKGEKVYQLEYHGGKLD